MALFDFIDDEEEEEKNTAKGNLKKKYSWYDWEKEEEPDLINEIISTAVSSAGIKEEEEEEEEEGIPLKITEQERATKDLSNKYSWYNWNPSIKEEESVEVEEEPKGVIPEVEKPSIVEDVITDAETTKADVETTKEEGFFSKLKTKASNTLNKLVSSVESALVPEDIMRDEKGNIVNPESATVEFTEEQKTQQDINRAIESVQRKKKIEESRATIETQQALTEKGWSFPEYYVIDEKTGELTPLENDSLVSSGNIIEELEDSYKKGALEIEYSLETYKKMMGLENNAESAKAALEEYPEEEAQLLKITDLNNPKQIVRDAANAAAEQLPLMVNSMREYITGGLTTGLAGAGIAAIAGQAGPQAIAPEELATVPGAFLAGLQVGGTTSAAMYMYKVEAGNAYEDFLDMGISEDTSLIAANAYGVVSSAIELTQVGQLAKQIPGVRNVLISPVKKAAEEAIAENLAKTSARKVLETAGKEYATYIGEQVSEELLQELSEIGIAEASKKFDEITKGSEFEAISSEEIINDLALVAQETALASAILPIPGQAINIGTGLYQAAAETQTTTPQAQAATAATETEAPAATAATETEAQIPTTTVAAEVKTPTVTTEKAETQPTTETSKVSTEAIDNYINAAIKNTNAENTLVFNTTTSSAAEKISNETGIDINNYTQSISDNNIRAFLKAHGESAETNLGKNEVVLTSEDIKKVSNIINSYDSLEKGTSVQGDNTLVFQKEIGDYTYNVQAQVAKNDLNVIDIWKENLPVTEEEKISTEKPVTKTKTYNIGDNVVIGKKSFSIDEIKDGKITFSDTAEGSKIKRKESIDWFNKNIGELSTMQEKYKAIKSAKEGTRIGKLEDFLTTDKQREAFKDVLDTDVMVLKQNLQTEKGIYANAAYGTYKGKGTIFLNNSKITANNLEEVILEEATHALRDKKGRTNENVSAREISYDEYKNLSYEQSAQRMVDYLKTTKPEIDKVIKSKTATKDDIGRSIAIIADEKQQLKTRLKKLRSQKQTQASQEEINNITQMLYDIDLQYYSLSKKEGRKLSSATQAKIKDLKAKHRKAVKEIEAETGKKVTRVKYADLWGKFLVEEKYKPQIAEIRKKAKEKRKQALMAQRKKDTEKRREAIKAQKKKDIEIKKEALKAQREKSLEEKKEIKKEVTKEKKEALKIQKEKEIAKKREALKAQKEKAIAKKKEAVEKVKATAKERETQLKEKAQITKERKNLLKSLKKLKTDKNKMRPHYKLAAEELLKNIDIKAMSIKPNVKLKLEKSMAFFEKQKELDPSYEVPERMVSSLERLNNKFISDLTQDEIKVLQASIEHIYRMNQLTNKLIGKQQLRELDPVVGQIMDAVGEVKTETIKEKGVLSKFFGYAFKNGSLDPENETLRILHWNKNNSGYKYLYSDLVEGQRNKLALKQKITTYINEKTKNININKWSKEKQEYTFSNGKLNLTKAEKISLYLHSLNKDNTRHLIEGGGRTRSKTKTFKFTKEDLQNLQLTESEERVAKAMQYIFDHITKDAINETSINLDGYSKADVTHYFPIVTDKAYRDEDFYKIFRKAVLEGAGYLKARTRAKNPIMIENVFTVLDRINESVSSYYGYAVPLRNAKLLLGRNEVKQRITNNFSFEDYNYFKTLFQQLEGNKQTLDPVSKAIMKLTSNLQQSILGINPWIWVKQTASLPTAFSELNIRDIRATILKPTNWNLLEKYSPVIWYRRQGFVTRESGDITMKKIDITAKSKWTTAPIQAFDSLTIGRIWQIVETETKRLHPDLKNSDFYNKVARRTEEVIYRTQPNYTEMQRSDIGRTQQPLVKMFTLFSTQTNKNYNLIYKSIAQIDKDPKKALKTFSAVVAGGLIVSLINVGKNKWRDKEGSLEDEFLNSIINNLYFVGDIYNLLVKGYSLDSTSVNALETLISSTKKLFVVSEDKTMAGRIKTFITALSQTLGIPIKNLEKELNTALKKLDEDIYNTWTNIFIPESQYTTAATEKFSQYGTELKERAEDANEDGKYDAIKHWTQEKQDKLQPRLRVVRKSYNKVKSEIAAGKKIIKNIRESEKYSTEEKNKKIEIAQKRIDEKAKAFNAKYEAFKKANDIK